MFMRHLWNVNYFTPFPPRAFFAIRGSALQLRYKRGINFVAAKAEIDQAQTEMDTQSVPRYLPEQRHECLFNPPHTSSFGGALERQIGTIGCTLDAMLLELGSQQLTHELHDTLMWEAAAIVHAHPITAILADINEPHPLPPAMLLPQTTRRLDTLLGSFTSQDLWPKEMEKGLTSCRPVLDQMEMWAYRQSANLKAMTEELERQLCWSTRMGRWRHSSNQLVPSYYWFPQKMIQIPRKKTVEARIQRILKNQLGSLWKPFGTQRIGNWWTNPQRNWKVFRRKTKDSNLHFKRVSNLLTRRTMSWDQQSLFLKFSLSTELFGCGSNIITKHCNKMVD